MGQVFTVGDVNIFNQKYISAKIVGDRKKQTSSYTMFPFVAKETQDLVHNVL